MADKDISTPGPHHRISIEPNPHRVIVEIEGIEIASTTAALTLREAGYPPVEYIPRNDIAMSRLTRTDHVSHCPYKGDTSYVSLSGGGERLVHAAWSYEAPYPAVSQIEGYLAFYPERVGAIIESDS